MCWATAAWTSVRARKSSVATTACVFCLPKCVCRASQIVIVIVLTVRAMDSSGPCQPASRHTSTHAGLSDLSCQRTYRESPECRPRAQRGNRTQPMRACGHKTLLFASVGRMLRGVKPGEKFFF